MGRPKKNPTLEEQIQAAEKKVLEYAEPYNKALEELATLREQQVEVREEKLLQAVRSSKRSYKEIMAFITSNPTDDEWYCPGEGF